MKHIRIIAPSRIQSARAILLKQPVESWSAATGRLGDDILFTGTLFHMASGATAGALKSGGQWIQKAPHTFGIGMGPGKFDFAYVGEDEIAYPDYVGDFCRLLKAGKPEIDTTDPAVVSAARGRVAVGWKTNGEIVIYVCTDGVDGVTGPKLAEELAALGCVNAINLDGGGSVAYRGLHGVEPQQASGRGLDNLVGITLVPFPAGDLAGLVRERVGAPYVYSAIGQIISEDKLQSFRKACPSVFTDAYLAKCRKAIGHQAFDCVGLIKFFSWDNRGTSLRYYDPATDMSADRAYEAARVKGLIATMPDVPGMCVRMPGHIGVYIGGGQVVEARGVDYGVVTTQLKDRPWTHWLQFPGVTYPAAAVPQPTPVAPVPATVRYGARGSTVARLQGCLNAEGHAVAADGIFGPKTDMAVRVYQKSEHLVVDGIVGLKTWTALLSR
jgi:hypothetical protein